MIFRGPLRSRHLPFPLKQKCVVVQACQQIHDIEGIFCTDNRPSGTIQSNYTFIFITIDHFINNPLISSKLCFVSVVLEILNYVVYVFFWVNQSSLKRTSLISNPTVYNVSVYCTYNWSSNCTSNRVCLKHSQP